MKTVVTLAKANSSNSKLKRGSQTFGGGKIFRMTGVLCVVAIMGTLLFAGWKADVLDRVTQPSMEFGLAFEKLTSVFTECFLPTDRSVYASGFADRGGKCRLT